MDDPWDVAARSNRGRFLANIGKGRETGSARSRSWTMAKRSSKTFRFGDHCFRAAHAGCDPEDIRREIAGRARASIQRSMNAGISVRDAVSDWPWLRHLRAGKSGKALPT